jgi:hypothetical protein
MVRRNRKKSMLNKSLPGKGLLHDWRESPTTKMQAISSASGTEYFGAFDGGLTILQGVRITSVNHPMGSNVWHYQVIIAGIALWISLEHQGDGTWRTTGIRT